LQPHSPLDLRPSRWPDRCRARLLQFRPRRRPRKRWLLTARWRRSWRRSLFRRTNAAPSLRRSIFPKSRRSRKPGARHAQLPRKRRARLQRRRKPPAARPRRTPRSRRRKSGRNKGALGFTLRRMQKDHSVLAKKDGWSANWGATNRLVVGPFATLAKAKDVEAEMKKGGSDAFVWRSDAGEELAKVGE